MKLKHFTLAFAYLSLLLLLLGGISTPGAAQPVTRTFYLRNSNSTVEVHHADGSISSAEFAAEMILYPDGRANGGWGLRELGTAPALTLYRVVAGQLSSDNIFTFTAQRLSPLPGEGINSPAVQLHRFSDPTLPPASAGTATFKVDISDPLFGTLSFVTQCRVLELPPGSSPDFNLAYINAPPQTVVVQTPSGSYTANFENVALVFPSVGAIGTLELPAPSGEQMHYDSFYGKGVYKSTDSGTTWSLIMQRARATNAKLTPGEEIVILLRPDPEASEPCRIYDIVGPQVNARFEAQASVTIF